MVGGSSNHVAASGEARRRGRVPSRIVGAIAANVLLPLLSGALLYVGFRAESLLGWRWAEAIGLATTGRALRDALSHGYTLPDWVRFTLPDALWLYALTFVVARMQRDATRAERGLWLAFAFALGPGAELGQLAGLVPGTYDTADLIATIVAFALALHVGARRALTRPILEGTTS